MRTSFISLEKQDKEAYRIFLAELSRQKNEINLIASENIASNAVLQAQGSFFCNKYAEGYPNKRYYGGCKFTDMAENLAIERITKLFNCKFANVQPHSGANANQAVFYAFLKPGDTIMGMSLAAGGHLTHGAYKTQSGTWFNSIQYGVKDDDHLINYDEALKLAKQHKPKLIIAGISSYSRIVDWQYFRKIADQVGALLMADIAHISGLIAGGQYPSALPYADIVTSTTHKTLRGPRGGIILTNNEEIAKKINSAVFPGLQGGPMEHTIFAKAVAFGEALQDDFTDYAKNMIENAKALSETLMQRNLKIVTGGTDCHLLVADLTPLNDITGKMAEQSLERAGIICNKNAIPFDKRSPFVASGLRFGSPAGTSRGFGKKEFTKIGHMIVDILEGLMKNGEENNHEIEEKIKREVKDLCDKFPIYHNIK